MLYISNSQMEWGQAKTYLMGSTSHLKLINLINREEVFTPEHLLAGRLVPINPSE
jgi:hypothetical protein